MTSIDPLHTFCLLLFLLIAFFYLLRFLVGHAWIKHLDRESEAGHGIMATGMALMLVPVSFQPLDLLLWNIVLFALASLWFTGRLLTGRPLLAFLFQKKEEISSFQADAIHVFMNASMGYMFLLMRSMALSMTPLAIFLDYGLSFVFLLLTLFYGREVYKDIQATKKNWLNCGANVAHVLMSGGMIWMFLGMISMSIGMQS